MLLGAQPLLQGPDLTLEHVDSGLEGGQLGLHVLLRQPLLDGIQPLLDPVQPLLPPSDRPTGRPG